MIDVARESAEQLIDRAAIRGADRSTVLGAAAVVGVTEALDTDELDRALAAGRGQVERRAAIRRSYDYVVVGAGAAGCVIASRLADAGADVLLVESGGSDDLPEVSTPGVWFTNIGGPLDWGFAATASPHVNDRAVPMAMGHVLGGGTSINATLWMRGFAQDFDDWAYGGCVGWGFRDLLPIFKAIEDWEGGDDQWRAAGGPVHVRTAAGNPHPSAAAFIEASRDMGIPFLDDMNAPMREGAGYVNLSITREGTRASASRVFLRPALGKPNLTVLLDTDVTQLTFAGTRCTGVQLAGEAGVRVVEARREVLVTAGGMASAKLLLLSGIGGADASRALGIEPVVDLKGVGRNFQDHPILMGVTYGFKGTMPPRSPTSNGGEVAAYVRTDPAKAVPDVKLLLQQLPFVTPEVQARYGGTPVSDGYTLTPALMRPSSRGWYRLKSADWRQEALLDANFLATDHDLEAVVRGTEMVRELGNQRGFNDIRDAELIPGRPMTKSELRDFARDAATSFGHPVGTCKMGVDEMAVVDPTLRVRGVENLRVCDSSVMPTIVTAPTSAATHVIAMLASQMILAEHEHVASVR